jgi:hypothetical protein
MARMSRAATETINALYHQLEAYAPHLADVETFITARARMIAEVQAKHPEVSAEQVKDAIDALVDARIRGATRQLKPFTRPWWLRWF